MDIVSLARFQFAMTTIFHFFFVPFSVGTALAVAIMETMYVIKKDVKYRKMAQFWGGIFLLSFAVGVVTGIIQEFQFGMNWSDYSRFVGDIFGAPLAVEALLAFFLESVFIGLWMFTWDKVSPKLHALFIWLVTIGSFLSAFWILVANSFMQHPVGFEIIDGRAVMTDFAALVTNSKVFWQFSHMITGAIVTGGMVVAGLSAFRLLNKNETQRSFYQSSMRIGLVLTLIGSLTVMGAGHGQMVELIDSQPMKFAAMEGNYEDTGDPAAWSLIAWANETDHTTVFNIEIPYMLSILANGKPEGGFIGMEKANEQLEALHGPGNYFVPVNAIYWNFRIMAGFGVVTFLLSAIGLWLSRQNRSTLFENRTLLRLLSLATFAPFLANTAGWLVTELGRFPWTVYGLFTIEDSISPNVSATSLFISNIVYFSLFLVLSIVMVYLVRREMDKGPEVSTLAHQELSDSMKEVFANE